MDNTIVTIDPKASGIAATAKATATIKASNNCSLANKTSITKTKIQITMIPIDNLNENSSKDFCKGVFFA